MVNRTELDPGESISLSGVTYLAVIPTRDNIPCDSFLLDPWNAGELVKRAVFFCDESVAGAIPRMRVCEFAGSEHRESTKVLVSVVGHAR